MSRLTTVAGVVVLLGAGLGASQAPPDGSMQSPQAATPKVQSQPSQPQQPFKWWQEDRIRKELGLTTEQSGRIEEIFQAALPKLTSGKDDLDRLEKRLSPMISDSSVPEAEVIKQIDRVESARADLGKLRSLMYFRMNRVLTSEQRATMKARHEQRERERQDKTRR